MGLADTWLAPAEERDSFNNDFDMANMTITGGAAVTVSGDEISVWCRAVVDEFINVDGQLMVPQIGGFF
jgi:hypothetical protein